jgi:hypothetical protein
MKQFLLDYVASGEAGEGRPSLYLKVAFRVLAGPDLIFSSNPPTAPSYTLTSCHVINYAEVLASSYIMF